MRVGVYSGLVLAVGLTAWFLYETGPGVEIPDGPVEFVVVSDPPDCDVYLDDKLIGRTSGGRITIDLDPQITDVRWMELRRPGFVPLRRALSAYSGLHGTEVKLRRCAFDALVASIPTDAEVWIGGELRGFTPLATKLLPDTDQPMRVEVRRAGYKPATAELAPPNDGAVAKADVTLTALPPRVQILTDPPGAAAAIDGKPVGETPVSVTLDEAARGTKLKITTSLDKHEPAVREIEIPRTPVGNLVASIKLVPQGTAAEIVTDPPGATIRLNGAERGTSPLTVRLTDDELASPIEIEALIPGTHFGRVERADISHGGTTRVDIPLQFYARRVVFAVDCAAPSAQDFELRRGRVKDQIHALAADQEFAVVALFGGRTYIGPEPRLTRASSEQKIRAYDRMDGLRYEGESSDAVPLLLGALTQEPESVWLYTSAPVDRTLWRMALEDGPRPRPTIQLVAPSARSVPPWLRDWLAAHRGAVITLGEQTASAP